MIQFIRDRVEGDARSRNAEVFALAFGFTPDKAWYEYIRLKRAFRVRLTRLNRLDRNNGYGDHYDRNGYLTENELRTSIVTTMMVLDYLKPPAWFSRADWRAFRRGRRGLREGAFAHATDPLSPSRPDDDVRVHPDRRQVPDLRGEPPGA